MFYPIHLLPDYQQPERIMKRWQLDVGKRYHSELVTAVKQGQIREYSDEEYIERDYYKEFESQNDYRCIELKQLKVTFSAGDNFKGLDFSYGSFLSCEFKNATFFGNQFNFTNFKNCKFENCTFVLNRAKGATFHNVSFAKCDFDDKNSLINCDLSNVAIENCYFYRNIFTDCRFMPDTRITQVSETPNNGGSSTLTNSELWAIYRGFKEAYASGQATSRYKEYYIKERQALTKHNTESRVEKFWNYVLELMTGYGVRPFRTFCSLVFVYLAYSLVYLIRFCAPKAFFISAGAFFTFGGDADSIKDLSGLWKMMYISESFFGISLIALFITVLANVQLKD